MFRKMRRQDRKLTTEKTKALLKKSEYGVLATIGDDEYPYAVPLHYVYHNNAIYIHCASEGEKLDGIRKNTKVSFCVVGPTEVIPKSSVPGIKVLLFLEELPNRRMMKREKL